MYPLHTLCASEITYAFSERILFSNLNFPVLSGQILNIHGDNGSGKSTLLRILAGLISPHGGTVLWNAQNTNTNRLYYQQSMCYIGHQTGLKPGLTILENVQLDCFLAGQNANMGLDDVLVRLGIDSFKHLPVEQLSAGQAKRVALARLLYSQVPLWIIDEPYTHLDQDAIVIVNQMIEEHVEQGGLAVLATHAYVRAQVPVYWIELS